MRASGKLTSLAFYLIRKILSQDPWNFWDYRSNSNHHHFAGSPYGFETIQKLLSYY